MAATKGQCGDCGALTFGGKVEDWTAAAPPTQAEKSRAQAAHQLESGEFSDLAHRQLVNDDRADAATIWWAKRAFSDGF
jgi:hypothetical protein